MEATLMKCGCVAQGVLRAKGGVTFDPPIPACVVHDCYEAADTKPDLAGRTAQCAYLPKNHAPKPSSYEFPFFEFRGAGSPDAVDKCKCGMTLKVHEQNGGVIPARKYAMLPKGCAGFVAAGPQEFDRFYCGCHGWD